jgi:hypothetical protein
METASTLCAHLDRSLLCRFAFHSLPLEHRLFWAVVARPGSLLGLFLWMSIVASVIVVWKPPVCSKCSSKWNGVFQETRGFPRGHEIVHKLGN